jgi:hypothetical protein
LLSPIHDSRQERTLYNQIIFNQLSGDIKLPSG